jgi:hypothetical protein
MISLRTVSAQYEKLFYLLKRLILVDFQVEASCLLGGNFTVVGGWPADPGCVYTCQNFANIPNMKKVSNLPVLANRFDLI